MDPLAALRLYLLDQAGLDTVYAGKIPRTHITDDLPPILLITWAGGGAGIQGTLVVADPTIEVIAYGDLTPAGPGQAADLFWKAHAALKALSHEVWGGRRLMSAIPSTRPRSWTDPDTDWPQVRASWRLYSDDLD